MDILDKIDARLDRIETKLDDHLERVSRAEESIRWLQGHVKFTVSVAITLVGGLLTYIFTILRKKSQFTG
jgi:hypothetical protein